MTEISQSHGTLNSVTDDSSTPSNNSQYFSVTSSLDVLDRSDDVYYSMDEDLEKEFRTVSTFKPIILEDVIDFPEPNKMINSNSTELEIFINDHIVDSDNWDKVYENLHSYINEESVSTDDDDDYNNYSTLTDSVINTFSAEKQDSDIEENASVSVNNITQMTNSVIEGELSEINDIIYESSISQEPGVNNNDDDIHDTLSLGADCDQEQMVDEISLHVQTKEQLKMDYLNLSLGDDEPSDQHNLSILEIVRKIEFSELEVNEPNITTEFIKQESFRISNNENSDPIFGKNKKKQSPEKSKVSKVAVDCKKQRPSEIDSIASLETASKKDHSKSKPIELVDESPIKSSSLCCSIKRKKAKNNHSMSSIQSAKSKSLFSFLKFCSKDRKHLKSPKSLPQLNDPKDEDNLQLIAAEANECDAIPFIDVDVGFYSDAYIQLAKQEVYCE